MQKKILVVDDEYDISSTLELALEMEGYEVRLSSTGREAMSILSTEALPDLIISDIMMPVMDGYAFTKALRAEKRYDRIPLILASAGRLDESRVSKGEYDHFLKKPFDLGTFLDLIEKSVKKKR